MLKDRLLGGTIPLPSLGKVFYCVSEIPNHFIAQVPKSNSALNGLREVTRSKMFSVFNFESNERFLVCTHETLLQNYK